MPDYSNEKTRAVEEKLAPFAWDLDESEFGINLIERGPYKLENGCVYEGSWS